MDHLAQVDARGDVTLLRKELERSREAALRVISQTQRIASLTYSCQRCSGSLCGLRSTARPQVSVNLLFALPGDEYVTRGGHERQPLTDQRGQQAAIRGACTRGNNHFPIDPSRCDTACLQLRGDAFHFGTRNINLAKLECQVPNRI